LRRPSIAVMGAFWVGLVVAGTMPFALWFWISVLICTIVLLLFLRPARLAFVLFLTGIFVLGCLRSPESRWNRVQCPREDPVDPSSPCILRVRVSSPLTISSEPVKVRVESLMVGYDWLAGKQIFLRGPEVARALSDGVTTAVGTFHLPRPGLNPYAPNPTLLYERQRVVGTVVASSFIDETARTPRFGRMRNRIMDLIQSAGGDKSRGVLAALLLGERADLDPHIKDVMIRAGTYHVIAISGLHVGIVVLLVSSAITAAGLPRGTRMALMAACVMGYVAFTGARPSALRAGTFFILLTLVRYVQWRVDIPNCVCAAGGILLVAFPHFAWDVGFRLSLAAVFGITLLVPMLQPVKTGGTKVSARVVRHLWLGVSASFAAQVATLPILLFHFGRVSVMGVASNIIVLPLVTLAVAAGLEASVCSLFWDRLALVFMKGAAALVDAMIGLMSVSTKWVDPVVFSGRPDGVRLAVYICGVGCIGLVCPRLRRGWRILGLMVLYAFLVFPISHRSDSAVVMTFIHVGDGDACLVEFPGGSTMLIDTGTGSAEHDAGRLDILPLLAMKAIGKVDTVIITHSHDDHYGGLASLIGNIDVGHVLIGSEEGESGYREVLGRCRECGIPVDLIGRGDTLRSGAAVLEILHPCPAYLGRTDDPNAQSVVLRLVYGSVRVLFTGDVTPEVQLELVDLGFDLSCDVLKVPHHGAPEGVAPVFAKACDAEFGVVSVGSRFASHPCPETSNSWRQAVCVCLRPCVTGRSRWSPTAAGSM
jgi:competence protein ComEC